MAWRVVRGVARNSSFFNLDSCAHGVTTSSLGDQKTAQRRWLPDGARSLALGEQVHGARVAWVTGKVPHYFIPATDGLLTRDAGVALGVFVADCAPILLAWPEEKIVGVVHAGWRGLAAGIIRRTGRELLRRTRRKNFNGLSVAVGPHIGSCCYQVGEDVARVFPDSVEGRLGCSGKFLNLTNEIVRQVRLLGIDPEAISTAPYCTMDDTRFFSHRRDHDNRRMLASIVRH